MSPRYFITMITKLYKNAQRAGFCIDWWSKARQLPTTNTNATGKNRRRQGLYQNIYPNFKTSPSWATSNRVVPGSSSFRPLCSRSHAVKRAIHEGALPISPYCTTLSPNSPFTTHHSLRAPLPTCALCPSACHSPLTTHDSRLTTHASRRPSLCPAAGGSFAAGVSLLMATNTAIKQSV